jgi:hypothetical protein
MEGETRRRLLEERERERLRQELRRESEREQQEDRLRELQAQRERLRGEREATHEQARRVQQSREQARARTVSDRAAGRALPNDRRSAREAELKRAQLEREVRRRPAGGDRPQIDEAYKSALEYDIYVRNNFGTRESFMQQASRAQRHDAEHVFREIDAAAANGGKVSDPELLLYRVEQVRASVERATAWPKRRAWLMAVALCVAVLALMYFVL